MRGRPAKPTPQRELEGMKWRADQPDLPGPGEAADTRTLLALGEPPEFLGEYGKAEWHRVGPILIEARLMTEADLLVFASYCMNVQVLIEAKKSIDEDGMTIEGKYGKVRNPALASFASASSTVLSIAAQFGMTPSSRARIRIPNKDDIPTLEKLLAGESLEDAAE